MKNPQDIDKFYVSPFDKFFDKFDEEHKKTASQIKEIKKHQRIAYLRDVVQTGAAKEEIWEQF